MRHLTIKSTAAVPTWLLLLVLDLRRFDQMFATLTAAALVLVPALVVLHRVEVGLVRIGRIVAAGQPQPVVEALIVDVVAERAGIRKPFVNLGPGTGSGRVGGRPPESAHQAVRIEPGNGHRTYTSLPQVKSFSMCQYFL